MKCVLSLIQDPDLGLIGVRIRIGFDRYQGPAFGLIGIRTRSGFDRYQDPVLSLIRIDKNL